MPLGLETRRRKVALAIGFALLVVAWAVVKDVEEQKTRADTAESLLVPGFSRPQLVAFLQAYIDTSLVCSDSARRAQQGDAAPRADGQLRTCADVIRLRDTYARH